MVSCLAASACVSASAAALLLMPSLSKFAVQLKCIENCLNLLCYKTKIQLKSNRLGNTKNKRDFFVATTEFSQQLLQISTDKLLKTDDAN